MKLSKYAQLMGVSYQTAWRWCKNNMIQYESEQVGKRKNGTPIMRVNIKDSSLPKDIKNAENVMSLMEYSEIAGKSYHKLRRQYIAEGLPNTFKTPGNQIRIMIFDEDVN